FQQANQSLFLDPQEIGGLKAARGREPTGLPSNHALLTKETAGLQNGNHRLFSLLGSDRNLDLTRFDEENRIGRIALREDRLSFPVLLRGFIPTRFRQESLHVKRWNLLSCHDTLPFQRIPPAN